MQYSALRPSTASCVGHALGNCTTGSTAKVLAGLGLRLFSSGPLSLKRRRRRLGANMYGVLILLVLVNLGFTNYMRRTIRRGPRRKFLGKQVNGKPITP